MQRAERGPAAEPRQDGHRRVASAPVAPPAGFATVAARASWPLSRVRVLRATRTATPPRVRRHSSRPPIAALHRGDDPPEGEQKANVEALLAGWASSRSSARRWTRGDLIDRAFEEISRAGRRRTSHTPRTSSRGSASEPRWRSGSARPGRGRRRLRAARDDRRGGRPDTSTGCSAPRSGDRGARVRRASTTWSSADGEYGRRRVRRLVRPRERRRLRGGRRRRRGATRSPASDELRRGVRRARRGRARRGSM